MTTNYAWRPRKPMPTSKRVTAELAELLQWSAVLNEIQLRCVTMRANGMGPTEIGATLHLDRKSVENAIQHGKSRMVRARDAGVPLPIEEAPPVMVTPPSEFVPAERLRKRSRMTTIANSRHVVGRIPREIAAKIAADPVIYVSETPRPKTRADCVDGPRPCPWVSCRAHLFLDVSSDGALKLPFADLDVDEIPETCSLDVADRGGITLEQVGALRNLTRERIRQVEVFALARAKAISQRIDVEEPVDKFDSPAASAIH